MQTIQFSFKKSIWLLLLVVAAFLFLSISSCNENNEKPPKGSCISLSKSKIEKAWGDYIKQGKIDYLSFITFYNPLNHEINVSVQAFKKIDEKHYQPIGPFVKLLSESGCADLLPKVRVGENIATPIDLEILIDSVHLKDFAYLALTPYSKEGNLAYNTKVIDKNYKVLSATGGTLPCPPCVNCRPACAADCTPPCSQKELDSLNNTSRVIRDSVNGK
jgi:hypothetical protein